MQYRRPRRNDPYWVEPEIWDNVVHFCRCYPVWLKELEALPDPNKGISYEGDKVQSSGENDPTYVFAAKRIEIERKVNLIETTAQSVNTSLWSWIVKGVSEKGITIEDLKAQGMPINKKEYAQMRKVFYYRLSKRI